MTTRTYTIPNISCGHCVKTIERELKLVDGVTSVKANEATRAVLVEVSGDDVLPAVEATLAEIGYPASSA